jgi:hypothetical protein
MKILMLKKINMMKKEKKFKEFVIQLFKKVWEKVVIVLEKMIKILMMKIFENDHIYS